jgi:hypothetical protein
MDDILLNPQVKQLSKALMQEACPFNFVGVKLYHPTRASIVRIILCPELFVHSNLCFLRQMFAIFQKLLDSPEAMYSHINLSNANATNYPGPGYVPPCMLLLRVSSVLASMVNNVI